MPHAVPVRPSATRSFAAAAAALAVVLTLGMVAAAGYRSSAAWVDHTLKVQNALDRWELAMVWLQNRARGYFATTDKKFLDEWSRDRVEETQAEAELERLVDDNPVQLNRVRTVNGTDAEVLRQYFEAQIATVEAGKHAEALARLGDGQRAIRAF